MKGQEICFESNDIGTTQEWPFSSLKCQEKWKGQQVECQMWVLQSARTDVKYVFNGTPKWLPDTRGGS